MMVPYNQKPKEVVSLNNKEITLFDTYEGNIDVKTVESFGNEWNKFSAFSDKEIFEAGDEYFDIITPEMLNKESKALDMGCGSGRWTKYAASKAGFVEAIDPSESIFSATTLLKDVHNVRLARASSDNIPFEDNSFDFVFSLGVLHHIPDTKKAMYDCVRKVKPGGHFMVYLYYNLENKNWLFRFVYFLSNLLRNVISRLPKTLKLIVCELIAIFVYMPLVLIARLIIKITANPQPKHVPLAFYANKSFNIIRTDSLDRFGTPLEQRFSKQEILIMMQESGLENVVFSDKTPFWHAVGKKKK
jgi:2-polyprenyl-3-methyl-5-hydroxy-6-metoxy-1,4-benzoquinol methylase